MRTRFGPLALAVLLVLAGCLGGLPGDDAARPDATTRTTATTGATTTDSPADRTDDPTTTPDSPETTSRDDAPPKGSQFVSLMRLENQSRHAEWPDNRTVVFGNLSERQRAVFRDAHPDDTVEIGPDEANPFSYYDDSRPKVVRYDGTWFYVRVVIV